MKKPECILFDLDGTLLDSVHDLARFFNILLQRHQQPPTTTEQLRPHVSYGIPAMLACCFNIDKHNPNFNRLKEELWQIYEEHSLNSGTLFNGVETLLATIENKNIPWGIVTNKSERFALPLLNHLGLKQRAGTIICADTLAKRKPDPEPLLYACQQLLCKPEQSWFIGDSDIDVTAGKAAHMKTIITLAGYAPSKKVAMSWQADCYVDDLFKIIDILLSSIE